MACLSGCESFIRSTVVENGHIYWMEKQQPSGDPNQPSKGRLCIVCVNEKEIKWGMKQRRKKIRTPVVYLIRARLFSVRLRT